MIEAADALQSFPMRKSAWVESGHSLCVSDFARNRSRAAKCPPRWPRRAFAWRNATSREARPVGRSTRLPLAAGHRRLPIANDRLCHDQACPLQRWRLARSCNFQPWSFRNICRLGSDKLSRQYSPKLDRFRRPARTVPQLGQARPLWRAPLMAQPAVAPA
jgi:hypothetical protein